MNYNNLTTNEKAIVSRMLNAKKALEKAQADYEKAVKRGLGLAKKSGTIAKGSEKIIYMPENTYLSVDSARLKNELPVVYAEYSKVVNRKDSVKVVL